MQLLLIEIEKLDKDTEYKDWYVATLQYRLTSAIQRDGNLAVAILNALEYYIK